MPTSTGKYLGGLRTELTHTQSGTAIITDAPTDNQGKGEAFSPTDLVATALGTCAVTTMAIKAKSMGVPDSAFEGMSWQVQKHMASDPRRISKVALHIDWPAAPADEALREQFRQIALHCPVALSLHPDLVQEISFGF